MTNFIETIKIKNFKIFKNLNNGSGIKLNKPNGIIGSGLNTLVGENNSGKSTIINSIAKLKRESDIHLVEKNSASKNTIILIKSQRGDTKIISQGVASRLIVEPNNINYEDIEIVKENRVWTSSFTSEQGFTHEAYLSNSTLNRDSIDNDLARRLANLKTEDLGRAQELTKIMQRIIPDFEDWDITSYSLRTGKSIAYRVNNSMLEIDSALGSGILNLFRIALALVSEKEIIFIDEPEVFLHPKAQRELCRILVESSKNKQIIYTTHSPYMIEDAYRNNSNILSFYDGEVKNIATENSNIVSSNYISWKVFSTNELDLHFELFSKYKELSPESDIAKFNDWIEANTNDNKTNRCSDPLKQDYGRHSWTTMETLPVWIRNWSHHPELSKNGSKANMIGYYRKRPTQSDINDSIDFIINEIKRFTV